MTENVSGRKGLWQYPLFRVLVLFAVWFALWRTEEDVWSSLLGRLSPSMWRNLFAYVTLQGFGYCLDALAACGVLWLAWKVVEKRSARDLGFRGPWFRPLALGAGIGIVLWTVLTVVRWLGGVYGTDGLRGHYPVVELCYLGFCVAVGVLWEEAVFRGWMLQTLERAYGTGWAVAISALAYALSHGHVVVGHMAEAWVHPVLHTLMLGLLLGTAFVLWRTLWVSIGLHIAWNMGGSLLYDSTAYGTQAVVSYWWWPPAYGLTGYGFISSVLVCAVALALLLIAAIRRRQWRTAKMPDTRT